MSNSPKPVILFLGGAGAHNSALIKGFAATNKYSIQLLTRSLTTQDAIEVGVLPNVELLEGSTYDDETLVKSLKGVDYIYVNTNGFATGEAKEIYWGIRIYEHAIWSGVKHFIYSGLPYVSKNGGFDLKRCVSFADGKGKFARIIPQVSAARADEMDGSYLPAPMPIGYGIMQLRRYAMWILEHPSLSAGIEPGVAIAHMTGTELAEAFTKVTGKKARWDNVPLEAVLKAFPPGRIGASMSPGFDDKTNVTAAEHFGPWWGIFRDSGGNSSCWKRDYELLDEILPDRERTIEDWMRREKYNGVHKPVLKTGLSL